MEKNMNTSKGSFGHLNMDWLIEVLDRKPELQTFSAASFSLDS